MTAFGNSAHLKQCQDSIEISSAGLPIDVSPGGQARSALVAQAWSFSPANASTASRVEFHPAQATEIDVRNHPLLANLTEQAGHRTLDNFNARTTSTASIEDLSRQLMTTDFSPPYCWPKAGQARAKATDPFMADNCFQSMEFGPDGTVKTTTTLQDLSASKIETVNPDRSRSLALTDHQGRPTVEQRFDATGQLISQTNNRFDNPSAPLIASHRTLQTATQTIETAMDNSGKVIASKIMPYSDLNANKSIA